MAIAVVSRITGNREHLEIAAATARRLLSSNIPLENLFARATLALQSVLQEDQRAATEHYAYLLEQLGTMIWTPSSVDRLLGLLAQTMGNRDQAMAHFEDALVFCRKAGYRPELAWTCHDYAETLLQRGEPGDRDQAISLLNVSLAIATELGMPPLMDRVAWSQKRAESQPVPAPAYPDGLTQREVEILGLVAAGKSNPEIAGELFISARTVSTHVSNILNKINAANRTEAATYANRQGLV